MDHDKPLQEVLHHLQGAGVTLNTDKCEFAKSTINFLGHVLDENGITADPEKIAAIKGMHAPINVVELRSFLGMVNGLMKFLPKIAEKIQAMRDLLHSDSDWYWGQDQEAGFKDVKADICRTLVLAFYDPQAVHKLSTDASPYKLEAVLLQEDLVVKNGRLHTHQAP